MNILMVALGFLSAIFAGVAAWPILRGWIQLWKLSEVQKAILCFAARAQDHSVWFTPRFKGGGAAVVLLFEGAVPVNDPMAETEALLGLDLLTVEDENVSTWFASDKEGHQETGSGFRRFGITPEGRKLVYSKFNKFNHFEFYIRKTGHSG